MFLPRIHHSGVFTIRYIPFHHSLCVVYYIMWDTFRPGLNCLMLSEQTSSCRLGKHFIFTAWDSPLRGIIGCHSEIEHLFKFSRKEWGISKKINGIRGLRTVKLWNKSSRIIAPVKKSQNVWDRCPSNGIGYEYLETDSRYD